MNNKRQKTSSGSSFNTVPDDIAGNIMSFCEKGRYLTMGIVNKQFNSLHKKEDRVTTTLGYLESDTPLIGKDGEEILPDSKTLNDLMSSKVLHRLVKRTIERGLEWDHFCVEEAAEAGYKEFFGWLEETDLFWTPYNAFSTAARAGNIDFMKFLVNSGYGFPDSCISNIAESSGYDHIVEWIEQLCNTKSHKMYRAIINYDWEQVQELYDDEETHYKWMVHDAIVTGGIETVEFFVSVGEAPLPRDYVTAEKYHRDMIWTYLIEHDV